MAHDEPELPMTEEQWEALMRQSDARAARYGELLDTLMDEPDRDEIIDKEMGWDDEKEEADQEWIEELNAAFDEAADAVARGENPVNDEALEQDPGELLPESVLEEYDDRDGFDESDRQLHRIPAYHMAMKLSEKMDRVVRPLLKSGGSEPPEDVGEAYIQIKIVAVKIAGGHGMGYDDDALGGNVVNCKRARAAADECEIAIKSLKKLKLISARAANDLLKDILELQKVVDKRIAELRARMWWQA